ncbi:hypothetical protein V1J52_09835 [Streptomyces sp. TRM 70351]|uniref:hypothetical protein n=1 Tax=Streptomyces sp. TRM 70351 TaxID=3116552 RepID=UPI002E7BDC3D|nr:hypothetical protein [Streptomyces sp. TRM 70351]MEE1928488.1 hypothetical protein [Streptomyces sp. TRM 70351]
MKNSGVSRRKVLTVATSTAAVVTAASAWGPAALAAGRDPVGPDAGKKAAAFDYAAFEKERKKRLAQYEKDRKRVLTGVRSPNGWEMEKVADAGGSVWTRPVAGTPLHGVAVRLGDVETVLVHVIRRFHYEADTLREGDVIGWRRPGTVRKGMPEGNQASGTAVQIRPGHYPDGASGGLFPDQRLVIRDILAELDGVVRWGGDDEVPHEALFYLDVPPDDGGLARVAARLRRWRATPGKGAGAPVDVLEGSRRKEAKTLERHQRAS